MSHKTQGASFENQLFAGIPQSAKEADMGLGHGTDSESRFLRYVGCLSSVIGHADRARPLHDYCLGLMVSCGHFNGGKVDGENVEFDSSDDNNVVETIPGTKVWSCCPHHAKYCSISSFRFMRPFIGIANIGPLSDPAQATHTPNTLLNLAPFLLGGLKQFVAFACALIGQQRIAAGGEAFAGIPQSAKEADMGLGHGTDSESRFLRYVGCLSSVIGTRIGLDHSTTIVWV